MMEYKLKIWRVVMMVYYYNYHNSRYYPLFHLLFKTRRFGDWILFSSSGGTYSNGLKEKLTSGTIHRLRLALSIGPN
jgi:hypothetical protein